MNRSTRKGSHRTPWLIFVAALTAGLGLNCGGATDEEVAVVPEAPTSRPAPAGAVVQPETTSDPRATNAFKLAVAEKGADVAVDDPIVQRFSVTIGSLESKFEENRQQIAEITISGLSRLREESGEPESHIDFLEMADRAFPTPNQTLTFTQYVNSYVKLKSEALRGVSPLQNIGKTVREKRGVLPSENINERIREEMEKRKQR